VRKRGSSPKLLLWNNALVSALGLRTHKQAMADGAWWGRLVENAVGAHLLNGLPAANFGVTYWREGDREVDFVVSQGTQVWHRGQERTAGQVERPRGVQAAPTPRPASGWSVVGASTWKSSFAARHGLVCVIPTFQTCAAAWPDRAASDLTASVEIAPADGQVGYAREVVEVAGERTPRWPDKRLRQVVGHPDSVSCGLQLTPDRRCVLAGRRGHAEHGQRPSNCDTCPVRPCLGSAHNSKLCMAGGEMAVLISN